MHSFIYIRLPYRAADIRERYQAEPYVYIHIFICRSICGDPCIDIHACIAMYGDAYMHIHEPISIYGEPNLGVMHAYICICI